MGSDFYLTEHSTQINDQLRQFGIGHMIKDGMVRRTILAALHDAGIEAPYELDVPKEDETKLLRRSIAFLPAEEENTLEEFAWAFGDDAVKEIEESVHHIIEQLHQIPDIQRLSEEGLEELLDNWHGLGVLDEDELLRRIELHMDELPEELTSDRKLILHLLEKRRGKLKKKFLAEHPEVLERLEQRRKNAGRTAGKRRIRKLFRNGSTGRKSISKTDFCTHPPFQVHDQIAEFPAYFSQILIKSCITAEGLRSFFQARRILVFSFSSSMMRIGRSVQRSSMDLGKTAVARPSCTQSMASLGSSQTQKMSGFIFWA